MGEGWSLAGLVVVGPPKIGSGGYTKPPGYQTNSVGEI